MQGMALNNSPHNSTSSSLAKETTNQQRHPARFCLVVIV